LRSSAPASRRCSGATSRRRPRQLAVDLRPDVVSSTKSLRPGLVAAVSRDPVGDLAPDGRWQRTHEGGDGLVVEGGGRERLVELENRREVFEWSDVSSLRDLPFGAE
jgi:hypothetical protein